MKRPFVIAFVLAFVGITTYQYRDLKILSLLGLSDPEFVYNEYNEPLVCKAKSFKAEKIDKEAMQVEGQNKRYWTVTLHTDDVHNENMKAFLVTKSEDPFTLGTSVMLAVDCSLLDKKGQEDMEALIPKDQELPLFSIYAFHNENKQLELATGIIVDQKIYFNVKKEVNNVGAESKSSR